MFTGVLRWWREKDRLRANWLDAEHRCVVASQSVVELRAELDRVVSAHREQERQWDEQSAEYLREINRLTAEQDQRAKLWGEQEDAYARLEATLREAEGEIERLTGSLQKCRADNDNLCTAHVNELNRVLSDHREQVAILETRVDELKGSNAETAMDLVRCLAQLEDCGELARRLTTKHEES